MRKNERMSRSPSLRSPIILLAFVLALVAGCGVGSQNDLRDNTLYAYAGAIRWGHIDDAWSMIDPEYARQHPMTPLDRERFEHVQVTGYQVKGSEMLSENEMMQLVEIRLINRHTQAERVVQDRQRWRWDPELRRWWLTTGLPRIAPSAP